MLAERGEVIAIAVYGRHRSGVVPGELYSVNRLIEKARVHSQSYRTYLQDVAAFEFARSEGKLESENGREYVWITVKSKAGDKFAAMDAATFASAEKGGTLKKDSGGDFAEQTISGKNGKPDWKKKIYRSQLENPGTEKRRIFLDELTNPYDGADRPEMLRKLAGKSFLAPYIKTRNSTAAINELQEDDDVSAMLDAALGQAFDAMPADRKTEKPAAIPEPSEDLAPPPVAPPAEKPEPVERKKSATKEEAATAPESPADDEENLLF
ncbi:MAG: hypothetical protein EHM48_03150 [Planctomycetaceae bacterium]|nr:MAG: hypothetical protein EHM48_03150 [Planctomycetaceae bacterium]